MLEKYIFTLMAYCLTQLMHNDNDDQEEEDGHGKKKVLGD